MMSTGPFPRTDGFGEGPPLLDDLPPQIPPFGVRLLDQRVLPGPQPFLEAFLVPDGRFDILMHREPDQMLAAMRLAEALDQALAVLICAPNDVVGDAGIERPMPAIGDHVDEVALPHPSKQAWNH